MNSILKFSIYICGLSLVYSAAQGDEIEIPKSLDDRLTVELFASEPDIVTVTGLTVDSKGRVLVVESHTHFRPEGYDGPETDRIRLLEDTNGDGRADRIETFFEGTTQTMNVAAHPNGWVYVATRNSVFRIRDRDGDDKAEEREDLVKFETTSDYPHNGISGFAFDFAGRVFFGLGENMGEDGILIADGVRLPANRGAGGIFRCNDDGSGLERMAIGFWNPFHLCFDAFGRMFTGDNDPGNRPPCRFLSIVDGGDYGYRRRTLEPFIATNGEVPGTLPMTSSTGESPTGILAYESDHLPSEYRGDVLVASWGEHRIDRYRLNRNGASFTAKTQPMIAGGEYFRPAGIAVASDGSLYIGDWADRSYDLHKKGRIWHVRAKDNSPSGNRSAGLQSTDRWTREDAARQLLANGDQGRKRLEVALRSDDDPRVRSTALAALIVADAITPELATLALQDSVESLREQAARSLPITLANPIHMATTDPSAAVRADALRRVTDESAEALLLEALGQSDPFLDQAARKGLAQSLSNDRLIELLRDPHPAVRLAAVLTLRDAEGKRTLDANSRNDVIHLALSDSDPDVLRATVEWIGREELKHFHDRLASDLGRKATTPELLESYLAALAQVDGVMRRWTKGTVGDWWVTKADVYRYTVPMLDDASLSAAVIAQVLRALPQGHAALTSQRLSKLLASEDRGLQIEALQRLRELPGPAIQKQLFTVASDSSFEPAVQAEAIVGINSSQPAGLAMLMQLAESDIQVLRHEALRGLRSTQLDDSQTSALLKIANRDEDAAELVSRILRTTHQEPLPPAEDLDLWEQRLSGPADVLAGQRVFFHPQGAGCAKCHRIDGRGQAVGPALVRVDGRIALTRRRLIEAILSPSKEIDPGYLPMLVVTEDGKVSSGIFYRHTKNILQLINSQGEIEAFNVNEIEEMQPSKTSIMPEGLAQQMTTQEFRDLLAYLLEPALDRH